jgi:hypothetical protein
MKESLRRDLKQMVNWLPNLEPIVEPFLMDWCMILMEFLTGMMEKLTSARFSLAKCMGREK